MKIKNLNRFFNIKILKGFLLTIFFCLPVVSVYAHQPNFPEPSSPDDYINVVEPLVSKAYYAELKDFPHTYRLKITEPTFFYTEILVPDFVTEKNRTGILVREEDRGVSEVARINPKDATWESFYEVFGGDTYLQGPKYETTLEPGNYIFEISTPNNLGKYVLVIGQEEEFSPGGFIKSLKDIYRVKVFMNKPFYMVFQSPFYYVPTLVLILLAISFWFYHKRKTHA